MRVYVWPPQISMRTQGRVTLAAISATRERASLGSRYSSMNFMRGGSSTGMVAGIRGSGAVSAGESGGGIAERIGDLRILSPVSGFPRRFRPRFPIRDKLRVRVTSHAACQRSRFIYLQTTRQEFDARHD